MLHVWPRYCRKNSLTHRATQTRWWTSQGVTFGHRGLEVQMGLSQCLGTTEAPSIGYNLKFSLLQWRGLCDIESKLSHRNIVVHLRLSFILI